jgi:carbamoyl-phosphate synthase small subunit
MSNTIHTSALLLLEDGTILQGKSFGIKGVTTGELCFNTGMTGYQEVFTDPSYTGQILIMNNAHIGNYGVKNDDVESNSVKVNGIIMRNAEEDYHRPMASGNLKDYLIAENLIAIGSIDTRALVAHVRSKGAMNCLLCTDETKTIEELKQQLAPAPGMDGQDLAIKVSTQKPYVFGGEKETKKVAVIDFGVKRNILQCLVNSGLKVKVFPATSTLQDIESFKPDGFFISNGPGDPSAMPYAVTLVQTLLATNKPLFGICLGHQLLALANGISTYKMHHGHRGLNHPVKNLITGKCETTTQNHGFGINTQEVKNHKDITITHINLNDDSIEGIALKNKPAFSVQYHPESTPGPYDSRYLFDNFKALINAN